MKATSIGAHLPDVCCEGGCDLQTASVHLLRRSISIDLQHDVSLMTESATSCNRREALKNRPKLALSHSSCTA